MPHFDHFHRPGEIDPYVAYYKKKIIKKCALDEEAIRVWTIAEDLEDIYQGEEEPLSNRQLSLTRTS